MFRPFVPTPSPSHLRRVRTLNLEHLESRLALSGLPEVAAILPTASSAIPTDDGMASVIASMGMDGDSNATEAAFTAAADGDTDQPAGLSNAAAQVPEGLLPPTLASPVSNAPLVGDHRPLGVGASEPTLAQTLSPPGGGSPPGIPPCIVEFTAALENGYWRLRGYVLDDSSPAGLTVHFSGILNGQATTDENGRFEFVVADSSVGVGWVYAHTIDVDGQSSDYEQVTLYA